MTKMTPTAEQIAEASQRYADEAFAWNGILDFAKAQYPRHSEDFQSALADAIRKALA